MASFIKVVTELVYTYYNMKIKGYRKSDQFPVAIKQVPRSRVGRMVRVGERSIPNEFYMHFMAAKCNGVVQVNTVKLVQPIYCSRFLIGMSAGPVM